MLSRDQIWGENLHFSVRMLYWYWWLI